ncbi:MAG: acyclic terpene utilization AtuA family protein [Ottowia sp.]|uniref:acyclic terpene utilization AtuA family protein n=1 Tax=Ottowia sp. TaxID=1898956 RepID=UPI003C75FEC7
MNGKVVRIGGASGFWGDSSLGAPQLVQSGQIDFLVFDYLAELTMSILAGARLKKPEMGYATDFVTVAMKSVLKDVVDKGIRVISNAGGVNPEGCAEALRALAAEQGVEVKIAVVTGDNVMPILPDLRAAEPPVRELQSGAPLPAKVLTANAYLGALPIKAALDAGAQIVITGRCVDSAVTLGTLMHAFNWSVTDYDRLSGGSLAGHILECGCQATGGLHTDWQDVPDWAHMGYPIVECAEDGSFMVTKPAGTGGLIAPQCVAEQLLYEIHDPANYLLPDVTCDWREVRIEPAGEERVHVSGALGRQPTDTYKVSATYLDGFKISAQLSIVGFEAVAKARRTGEAILERVGEMLKARGMQPLSATNIEVLGAESCYGPHAMPELDRAREVVLRLTACHAEKAALELLAREIAPAGTSWAPGTTGSGGGRSSASPSIRQYAFLLNKERLTPAVTLDGKAIPTPGHAKANAPAAGAAPAAKLPAAGPVDAPQGWTEVPLIRLAWARSGDKGNTSNIGIIARRPEWLPLLRAELTEARVAEYLRYLVDGPVTRYDLPGIHAFNLVCEQALGGGGMASLRNDPLGKGMAQILLSFPVRVPAHWLS